MKFDYDHVKSMANQIKHGVSLEEAKGLWLVPNVQIEARMVDETRFMIIGKFRDKFYSCVFTMRSETIRLISMRRSREREEKIYHEFIAQK